MKVESSIKENLVSSTVQPLTKLDDIINAICEWNGITLAQFREKIGAFSKLGTDMNGQDIYVDDMQNIINPIGKYLVHEYQGKTVVFEKGNDKFFGKLKCSSSSNIRYQLGEKVIEIPFTIRAENEDTGEGITIFPKVSDIIQPRMQSLYVVNTGWAERQKIEKEIMSKLIELAQVRGGNEIISTQNSLNELKETLKKRGIDLTLGENVVLKFPRRTIRDTANNDDDYIAPPIEMCIDFDERMVKSKGYSCHGFGTPSSWGNPCWGNRDNEIRNCLRDCDLKGLINLIISWAYGYNSQDTGRSHDGRHPLGKLKDYIWYVYDHRSDIDMETTEGIVKNLPQIKHDLMIDDWLEGTSGIKEFLSNFEGENEKSE